MDFVAWILRRATASPKGDDKAHSLPSGFHFTLYAAFESTPSAFDLTLLRKLATRFPEYFTLNLRFAGEMRWDLHFIMRELFSVNGERKCDRLWVCGSPSMNVTF